jgi:Na+/H+ antiporter NhaD/arsenite permease-like protein
MFIKNPVPYMALVLLAVMICLIFVDVMSISALVCISAMVMVISLVVGNHWRGHSIWVEDGLGHEKLSAAERVEVLEEFFEELFKGIDWSLLLIFLGTFVVVANIESTHLPKYAWSFMVGSKPFQTASSVAVISLFVLVSSQFLGNVALIQLAVPQVSVLPDEQKRYAWAVLSFVATVGGNLTITGSAANIIVCEKAQRLGVRIDFFRHLAICFFVTFVSCVIGAGIISALIAAGL